MFSVTLAVLRGAGQEVCIMFIGYASTGETRVMDFEVEAPSLFRL